MARKYKRYMEIFKRDALALATKPKAIIEIVTVSAKLEGFFDE